MAEVAGVDEWAAAAAAAAWSVPLAAPGRVITSAIRTPKKVDDCHRLRKIRMATLEETATTAPQGT